MAYKGVFATRTCFRDKLLFFLLTCNMKRKIYDMMYFINVAFFSLHISTKMKKLISTLFALIHVILSVPFVFLSGVENF